MSEQTPVTPEPLAGIDVRDLVRQAVEEFVRTERTKAEPAYKAELHEERKRREALEGRVNQLVEENRQARAAAEEADRSSQIRSELQRLGVSKVDLAFRAVKDDVVRDQDGTLRGKGDGKPLQEYLSSFVQDNPELLPARIAGGSGIQGAAKGSGSSSAPVIDMDKIKPGMNPEEMERVRQEISRLASQALRGL
jgi:hypothetical protein